MGETLANERENEMHGEVVYEIDGIQVVYCPQHGGVFEVWQPEGDGPDGVYYECVADVEEEDYAIAIADEIWENQSEGCY